MKTALMWESWEEERREVADAVGRRGALWERRLGCASGQLERGLAIRWVALVELKVDRERIG